MVSPADNIIDSRDIIAELNEFESDVSSLQDDIEEAADLINELEIEQDELNWNNEHDTTRIAEIADEIEEHEAVIANAEAEISELEAEFQPLVALAEEAKNYSPDWKYGVALIADDYFEDYAYELAGDIGAVNSEMSWPCDCIDWSKAADALKMDYTSVNYDGKTYWIR